MLSDKKKKEIIKLIIASDSLKNAPTSIALLKYLLDAHLEKRPLKEGVIDIEFYGSEVDETKNNPRVRVNIYNLRNKLEKYYADQGRRDEWQVHIEKGQYNLKFKKRNEKGSRRYHLKTVTPYLIAAIAIILLLLTYWPKMAPNVWSGFFKNGHHTNLFIGDAFGYSGKTAFGNSGWTRDYSVNNLEEFYQMLEKNPDLKKKLSPTEFTYATRMAENATHDLSRFFTEWQSDFNIKYATQTSFTDIKKENTIYVGRLKDQTNFVYLFNEANPYFQLKNEALHLKGHPSLKDTVISLKSNYKKCRLCHCF